MAIGWISVLKTVPWGEVISNAPKVADGAKKLWGAVADKVTPPRPSASADQEDVAPELAPIVALQGRVASVEAATAELHEQMRASSALIKTLAEQNAELIKGIEIMRRRMRWWSIAMAIACIAVAVQTALVYGRWVQ
jgi:hypothetical protein